MTCRLILPSFEPLWWLENQDKCFFNPKIDFSTYFWLKIPRKHLMQLDKLIQVLKKLKKPHPNPESTLNKKSYWTHICFSMQFQGEKELNVKSPHQMEQIDLIINCFCGQKQCNKNFSLALDPNMFLSPLLNHKFRKHKK